MINVQHGYKKYKTSDGGVVALKDICLEFESESFCAIVGQSGSGKSTLLNVLAGYDFLDQGDYYYQSLEVQKDNYTTLRKLQKEIGMVFQDYQLLDYLTVKDNLWLPSYYQKKKPNTCWIEQLGIEECLQQYPYQLSGGQKQRCAIARILMYDKQVILADEPTGALDEHNSEILMELFAQLQKQHKTIIIVTHDQKVANCCRKIIRLENGHVVD